MTLNDKNDNDVVKNIKDEKTIAQVKGEVKELCDSFPLYQNV